MPCACPNVTDNQLAIAGRVPGATIKDCPYRFAIKILKSFNPINHGSDQKRATDCPYIFLLFYCRTLEIQLLQPALYFGAAHKQLP